MIEFINFKLKSVSLSVYFEYNIRIKKHDKHNNKLTNLCLKLIDLTIKMTILQKYKKKLFITNILTSKKLF